MRVDEFFATVISIISIVWLCSGDINKPEKRKNRKDIAWWPDDYDGTGHD